MSRNIPSRLRKDVSKQGPQRELEGIVEACPKGPHHSPKFVDDGGLNDQKVENSMNKLHQLIINLVASFTKIVTIDEYSWPQACDTHIWFEELDALFHQALGLEKQERLDHAFRRLKVDLRDASVYLRMIIAAEVWEKILTASFPDIPMLDRKWAKRAFRSLAEDKGPEYEDNVAQLALLALADDEDLKTKARQQAETFTDNLLETINPMLLSYKSFAVDREASKSRKTLLKEHSGKVMKDIYHVAMRLRMDMNLKSCTYTFFWPAADESFDETTMNAEVHQQRVESPVGERQKGFRVAATLLPGVRRIEPPEPGQIVKTDQEASPHFEGHDPEGIVVYKALVYLRDTRA